MIEKDTYYGQGSGSVLLKHLDCVGVETNILDCQQRKDGVNYYCGHTDDVGLNCQPSDDPSAWVRLRGGIWPWEGRVEINLYGAEWYGFCLENFGVNEARAVCRTLGYNGTDAVVQPPKLYGRSNGPWSGMSSTCTGEENNALECVSAGSPGDCTPEGFDVGVACRPSEWSSVPIRLVNGTSGAEGRVEVNITGRWETVCDYNFKPDDVKVVCRMLGYNSTTPISQYFGHGSGPIQIGDIACSGNESNIFQCHHERQEHQYVPCGHHNDIGVKCDFDIGSAQVRLVDGSSENEGRVELNIGGQWGTICGHWWTVEDAAVLCRMLGYNTTAPIPMHRAYFGQGTGPIMLDHIQCKGNEEHILMCNHDGLWRHHCDHGDDAGVICPTATSEVEVRLVDGPSPREGRVEVRVDGVWGTVCDHGFDLNDAAVVCRMLKYYGRVIMRDNAYYGEGSGAIVLSNLNCTGYESTIMECGHPGIGWIEPLCDHGDDAGVACSFVTKVRLANGPVPSEGRVELSLAGDWDTLCEDNVGPNEAKVICRMLGYEGEPTIMKGAFYGDAPRTAILPVKLNCTGEETNIEQCMDLSDWTSTCSESADDVGVACQPAA